VGTNRSDVPGSDPRREDLPGAVPPVRTWRRLLRALTRPGWARAVRGGPGPSSSPAGTARHLLDPDPGPRASGLRHDHSPLRPRGPEHRPRQGRLGDCWVIAAMLAIHEVDHGRLPALLEGASDGIITVRLPGTDSSLRVDRRMPVGTDGRFLYAGIDGGGPSWPGVLEKAVAGHLAGSYPLMQRGFARYGLQLLLGSPVRTLVRLPDAAQILTWMAQGRAVCASTHPFSPRVPTAHGPLPANHVYAVVGAEARSGHVHLRNPVRPGPVLRVDARTFRRGFLSVDVSAPLR